MTSNQQECNSMSKQYSRKLNMQQEIWKGQGTTLLGGQLCFFV